MGMNTEPIRRLIEAPSGTTVSALLQDEATVFWVDWREEDDAIAEYCESILQTGSLSAELNDAEPGEDYDIYVLYGGKRLKAPLNHDGGDRHVMIRAINEILAPDYEIRFCLDSMGSDTLAFLPLLSSEWSDLERDYPRAIGRHFHKMTAEPNVFTEHVPIPEH